MGHKKQLRIAGLLYLLVIISGVFAEFFVRAEIFVSGDFIATANNLRVSQQLFRFGFVSDLIMITTYFFLPQVLYTLLQHINSKHAKVMVYCVVVAASILAVNILNHIAPILLINGEQYLTAFNTEQINGLIQFFLKMHQHGYMIAQVFFGLWLFPLGYLLFKSDNLPKILGMLLMIGSISYLLDFLLFFLCSQANPTVSSILTLPADLAEFSFCIWLLIKGFKTN